MLIEFDWTDLSVYEVDPSKGKGRKITGTPIANPQVAADISPDGSSLAVQLPAEHRIRVLSLNGGGNDRDDLIPGRTLDGVAASGRH